MDALTLTRTEFFSWLDRALEQPMPQSLVGFHFNLYEAIDSVHVQLIGTSGFTTEPEYSPSDEVFTTGENVFEVPFQVAGSAWPEWLESLKELASSYISSGGRSAKLRESLGVGIGFVDGDMHVLWQPAA